MARQPIISDADTEWLLGVPKYIDDKYWRSALLPPSRSLLDLRGRFDLPDLPDGERLGGRLHIYSRQNLTPGVEGDWSVGLVYTDYADRSYRVIRCNGPHPSPHPNEIEGDTIIRHAHVHRLTERYQRIRKPDGFAEATTAYSTIDGALNHLVELANLQPAGILFL